MGFIGDIFGGGDAADAATEAANIQAQAQREALAYLKERERIPQQFREEALSMLGGLYGLTGQPLYPTAPVSQPVSAAPTIQPAPGVQRDLTPMQQVTEDAILQQIFGRVPPQYTGAVGSVPPSATGPVTDGGVPIRGSQQDFIAQVKQSPLYSAILGTGEAGEEAILRSAAATGGLRSGDTQSALYEYNQQLANRALLESYNQQVQGLQGLAGLPSNANQIASQMAGVGQTLGQGQIASAQAEQAALGLGIDTALGVGGLIAAFSDRRLKDGIIKIGENGGFNIYAWTWNKAAEKLGLSGMGYGVMADEVEAVRPELITERMGYKVVDYSKIPIGSI